MSSEANVTTDQYNFLSTLAAGCPKGLYFLVAEKRNYPDGRVGFPASMWREQALTGPWYFSTGASDSRKSRRAENLKAVRAIVIDDVGTKVDPVRIKAAPTWVLETSKDNFQWGFLLEAWSFDIAGADALFAGLVAAGLQDKGVRTACRLFRVPGSVNDKEGRDSFKAELIHFDADVTYTLASLTKALKVKPGAVKPRRTVDPNARPAAGKPDPVYDWLAEQGLIRHQGTDGWFEIECPWAEEHDSDKRTDAKFRPLWADPEGKTGVMCHHGHGEDGGAFRRRFIDWVKEQGGPSWPTPHTGVIDPGAQAVLRKVADAMKPPSQTRKQTKQTEPDLFTIATLRDAIGVLSKASLPDLDVTKEGLAKLQPCSSTNVEAGLATLQVQARLNLMTGRASFLLPESVDMPRFGSKTPQDIDSMIVTALCDTFGAIGMRDRDRIKDALAEIANQNLWHPAKDWIESKPWDGQDRLEALAATLPTDNPDLWRRYLRRWLLQGIEAACGWVRNRESMKAMVLVLVGPQRIGKTSWLMSLVPSGFGRQGKHLDLNGFRSTDSIHQFLQAWIAELGELDSTTKKTEISLLKAFASQTTDTYRIAWGRSEMNRPRCTSICASVNEFKFLNDPTGSGRFLPVTVTGYPQVDHAIDMQQLWAQMHTYWDAGEPHYLTREEEKLQAVNNVTYQTIDGIAERIGEEIERRKNRDDYPHEYVLQANGIARMLGLKWDDISTLRRVGTAVRKLMGEGRDLRHRTPDGKAGKDAWIWHLADEDFRVLGMKPPRTVIPKPPV